MRCCSQLLPDTAASTLLRLLKPRLTQIYPHCDVDMWGHVWMSHFRGVWQSLNFDKKHLFGFESLQLLVWPLNGGSRILHSPSSPFFPACFFCLVSLRDSLCTALQTKKLCIWSTGLSALLTPSFRLENWVPGNLSALTERSQLGIRGMRGRGGKSSVLRLFPLRTLKISTFSEPW